MASVCYIHAHPSNTIHACILGVEHVISDGVCERMVSMSRRYAVPKDEYGKKRYESDLDATEWTIIAPHVAQKDGPGKKRTVNIRQVLNAIFYRVRTGCQWRMLPKEFPPWYHVWYYDRVWRDDGTLVHINTMLRREVRIQAGCDPEP